MRFIHCSDLHLDSPLRGLDGYEGAPVAQMRQATRRAFTNVVDLAIERAVDFVLIAGDLYDGDWPDFNTGLFLAAQLRRLADADIQVFLVYGNHDALSRITRSIPLPRNTTAFPGNEPGHYIDERLGLAVHGQSFATEAVTRDLAAGYPGPLSGLLNVGLLHTALAGREGHQPYAPTTAERLADKGYDYWALGHIHAHEVVRAEPWIVFPGNTQGRHARETGAKGCVLVEAEAGVGIESVEFVPTDVARWAHLSIDIADLLCVDDLHDLLRQDVKAALRAADDRVLALRLSLTGRGPLHGEFVSDPEALRAQLSASVGEASGGMAWLEKVQTRVSAPLDLARLAERDDPIGELVRSLDALASDPGALLALAEPLLADLGQKLPSDLRANDLQWPLDSPQALGEVLAAARERLLAAISAEAGA